MLREMTVTTWIANNRDEDDDAERDITSLDVDFEEHEMDHELPFHSLNRVSYFSHTLQLVVQKFNELTTFRGPVKRVHNLVSKWNMSAKATERLIVICGKKLIRSCPTRRSSTYSMCQNIGYIKHVKFLNCSRCIT